MLSARTVPNATDALGGLTILQRGWLSSNNVLIHGTQDEPGAWLIDTGHACHAEQTIALVDQALAGLPLAGILNTHLHNDHCGGNAALQRHFGLRPWVPQSRWQAVQQWDMDRLGHSAIGHDCPRFDAGGALAPGESLRAGGRQWQALAAPGHDPDSLVLFEPQHRVLISADALWHNGFGLEHLFARFVAATMLTRTYRADHHRVHNLQMRWIECQRDVHRATRRGDVAGKTLVILHVTRRKRRVVLAFKFGKQISG